MTILKLRLLSLNKKFCKHIKNKQTKVEEDKKSKEELAAL